MNDKQEKALVLSDEILEGIETEEINISSVVLKCLRLARLIGDLEAMEWLQYETSGYPSGNKGLILHDAFIVAEKRSRCFLDKGNKKVIFTELAAELESEIESLKLSIGNTTTMGASVGGENAAAAMSNLTNSVTRNMRDITFLISAKQKKVGILKGQYYQYALSVNVELGFSKGTGKIFDKYRSKVDLKLVNLVPKSIQKLQAVYNSIDSDNQEQWSQALTSLRRLFEDVSNALFQKQFPDFEQEQYETSSGKKLKITGDSYVNRLFAVIDDIDTKAPNNTLIGSNIIRTVDWVENLHNKLCKGVHDDISYEEAMRSILHSYICLGDLITVVDDILD